MTRAGATKDNFSGRYSFTNYEQAVNQGTLAVIPTSAQFSRPQNFALNWTRTISPTLINEARVGFNRAVFITDNAFDWAGIGDGNANWVSPAVRSFLALVQSRWAAD